MIWDIMCSDKSLKEDFMITILSNRAIPIIMLLCSEITYRYRRCKHYSGLNLNQYGVASPCRTICTVCGFVALS